MIAKKIIRLIQALVALVLVQTSIAQESSPGEQRVSLVNLISNPDLYNEKRVSVKGYLKVDGDGAGLFLVKEHAKNNVFDSAIVIDFEQKEIQCLQKFSDLYVRVKAKFSVNNKGHLGVYAGSFQEVSRIYPEDGGSGRFPVIKVESSNNDDLENFFQKPKRSWNPCD